MKEKKDKTAFTAREVAVLIEELKSQFRIFGKNLSTVKRKGEVIFEQQGKQAEDIFIIKADIRKIQLDIVEIKEIIKSHERRITPLEEVK